MFTPAHHVPRQVGLNEAATIEKLVLFIKEQGSLVTDIIVVDGGSTDETRVRASSAGPHVIAIGFIKGHCLSA